MLKAIHWNFSCPKDRGRPLTGLITKSFGLAISFIDPRHVFPKKTHLHQVLFACLSKCKSAQSNDLNIFHNLAKPQKGPTHDVKKIK